MSNKSIKNPIFINQYRKKDVFSNKENIAIPQFSVTNSSFTKMHKATAFSSGKPFAKERQPATQPLDASQQLDLPQRIVQSPLNNVSTFVNINIDYHVHNCECSHNNSFQRYLTLQELINNRVIKECIALTLQYIDEKQYDLAWDEAKRGLNLPGCSNGQKIELAIALSSTTLGLRSAPTKSEDYLYTQEAIQTAIALPECTDAEKITLYNNLSFIRWKELKDYRGAHESAQAGLALPNCSVTQNIRFLFNLFFAYRGLKYYDGEKLVLQGLLSIIQCTDADRFMFLFSLSVVYNALNDYNSAEQVLQIALNLKYPTIEKIKVLAHLSKVWIELEDHVGAQQALQTAQNLLLPLQNNLNHKQNLPNAEVMSSIDSHIQSATANNTRKEFADAKLAVLAVVKLPECNDFQKLELLYQLATACNGLNDYAGAKQALQAMLVLVLPLSYHSNVLKIDLLTKFCAICDILKDNENLKVAMNIRSSFEKQEERDFVNESFRYI